MCVSFFKCNFFQIKFLKIKFFFVRYNNKNDKRCQMTDSFPNGYVTECKQRYISRHLLTYNADGRTIEKKLFKIPSCCQCVVRNEH